MSRSPADEATLLERVAAGDQSAVATCVQRYGRLVWALSLRLSPTREDAEDATQEIFLDVWRHAARFNATLGSERVFIMTIARRRLIDRLRKSAAAPIKVALDSVAEGAASSAASPERAAQAHQAVRLLADLPADNRRMLELALLQGLSHREIAEQLDRPLGTVKTRIRRTLLELRSRMSLRVAFTRPGPGEADQ